MYFLYLKLLLPYIIATGARDLSLRVLGGRDVRPDEFPYIVRLEMKNAIEGHMHLCTASVLTPTASVTAAHCCITIPNWTNVIRYGSKSGRPTEDDRFSDVLSCAQHPATKPFAPLITYLKYTHSPDLAVLATQPIHVSGYARVSAIDYRVLYGQRVQALGYGITEHKGLSNDTLSLKLPLQVMDAMWSRCDEYPFYPMVCLMTACGARASLCPGDSGGPVVHASGIVGVVSMGTACLTEDNPIPSLEFIAPLSIYFDWITDKLADTTVF